MALDTQSSGSTVPFPVPPAAASPDAATSSAPALPTLNPGDSPYKPLNLPQEQPRQKQPDQQQQQPPNLGATSHAGAAAYLIDNILKGASHGYAQGQQIAADQYNKKLNATQSLYNDQAAQLYDLAKSGRAGTFTGPAGQDGKPTFVPSDEFNQIKGRMKVSWDAMMDTVGARIPQPKKSKKGGSTETSGDDPQALLKQAMDHKGDPQGALAATYQLGLKIGPPVIHQITGFLTPEYVARQKQGAQTSDNQSQAAVSSSHAGLTTAQMQDELQTLQAKKEPTDADKSRITQLREALSPIPRTTTDKPITRPDIQTVKTKDGRDISAQWDGKRWNYLNGQPIPETDLGPEAKVAQKVSTSQWAQGLNAYATSHKPPLDPNSWETIRAYESDQYSAKNPLAERKLSLTARNTAVGEARLALQRASTDWHEAQDIYKHTAPDIAIAATSQEADELAAHPTGPGDVKLTMAFFEVAKAADPGSGSGIRFTKQEQDLIQHARGLADAAQANVERWGKGTLYDDQQRAEMADIIKKAAKRSNEATARYMGAAQTLAPRATAAVTGGAVGGFTVTDPKGKLHTFDSQEQADHFKKLAGIK